MPELLYLTDVNENIIKKIKEYLQYVEKQKIGLTQLENMKKDLEKNFFTDKKSIKTIDSVNLSRNTILKTLTFGKRPRKEHGIL